MDETSADTGAYLPMSQRQGTRFERSITVSMDLTGWTVRMQARRYPGAPNPVEFTCTLGAIDTELEQSEVLVVGTPAQLAGMTAMNPPYVYDMIATDPGGNPKPLLFGPFVVTPAVTV